MFLKFSPLVFILQAPVVQTLETATLRISTVEPRYNDMPREQRNWIVKLRYHYIETPDITILP